jgi:hypothetical protein
VAQEGACLLIGLINLDSDKMAVDHTLSLLEVVMSLSVKKGVLWRRQIENRPGALAETLKMFAKHGINLEILMGYAAQGASGPGTVEIYPISGAKAEAAAKEAGLSPMNDTHCLMIEGDDKVGMAHEIAHAVGGAGINMHFAMFTVVGKKFNSVLGFGSAGDADKASNVIQKQAAVAR